MANYRQWLWDGEWHDYPKGKEPIKIETLPPLDIPSFSNDLVEISGLDYLKVQYQFFKHLYEMIVRNANEKPPE